MSLGEKKELLEEMRQVKRGRRKAVLEAMRMPRPTYYRWLKKYREQGEAGLVARHRSVPAWNRLRVQEEGLVVRYAQAHPDRSARVIAAELADLGIASVSEPTVYRVLKRHGLWWPRPAGRMAEKERRHKTTRADEQWQCDGTILLVVNYGYYRVLPVLDDYSRKLLAAPVKPDESGGSASDAVELARETAKSLGHKLEPAPMLLTDNGSGFKSEELAAFLGMNGIEHTFGAPYHPQTQGKVERFNRTLKDRLCLVVYCSPGELQRAVDEAVKRYNATPHKAHKNVSPDDVYAGRKEEVLRNRQEFKLRAMQLRREQNQLRAGESTNTREGGSWETAITQ